MDFSERIISIKLVSLLNELFNDSKIDFNRIENRDKAIQVSRKIFEIDPTSLDFNLEQLFESFTNELSDLRTTKPFEITHLSLVKEEDVIKEIKLSIRFEENDDKLIIVELKNILNVSLENGNTALALSAMNSRPELIILTKDLKRITNFCSNQPIIWLHPRLWNFETINIQNFNYICGATTVSYVMDALLTIALNGISFEDLFEKRNLAMLTLNLLLI